MRVVTPPRGGDRVPAAWARSPQGGGMGSLTGDTLEPHVQGRGGAIRPGQTVTLRAVRSRDTQGGASRPHACRVGACALNLGERVGSRECVRRHVCGASGSWDRVCIACVRRVRVQRWRACAAHVIVGSLRAWTRQRVVSAQATAHRDVTRVALEGVMDAARVTLEGVTDAARVTLDGVMDVACDTLVSWMSRVTLWRHGCRACDT
ncbi:hypothetical protein NN561_019613 [Cricetulus griseus]